MSPRWKQSLERASLIFIVGGAAGAAIAIATMNEDISAAWNVALHGVKEGVAVTALCLAYVAFAQAYALDAQASDTFRRAEEIILRLEKVGESVSTRALGVFPAHLHDISRIVHQARAGDTIDIVADCVDYGSFFDPDRHKSLHAALLLARDRRVRVNIYAFGIHPLTRSAPIRLSDLNAPFRDPTIDTLIARYRKSLETDVAFREHLRAWAADPTEFGKWLAGGGHEHGSSAGALASELSNCEAWLNGTADDIPTALETLLCARECFFEQTLQKAGMMVKRLNLPSPAVSFWRANGKAVVFMFGGASGHPAPAFYSRDSAIMNVMVTPEQ